MTVTDGSSPASVYADERLAYCLRETFDPSGYSLDSFLAKTATAGGKATWVLELGPRLNFTTAWSTNAVSILKAAGLTTVPRIEVSRRYLFVTDTEIPAETKVAIAFALHDKMTEQIYEAPMTSFDRFAEPDPVTTVPILSEGRVALERINKDWGLGMDEDDVVYYTGLFRDKMKRYVHACASYSCTGLQHSHLRRVAAVSGTRPTSRCLTSVSPTQSTAVTGSSRARL